MMVLADYTIPVDDPAYEIAMMGREILRQFVGTLLDRLDDEELSPYERTECLCFGLAVLEDFHEEIMQMFDPEYRPDLQRVDFRKGLTPQQSRIMDCQKAQYRIEKAVGRDYAPRSFSGKRSPVPPGFKPAPKLDEFQFDKAAARIGKRKRKPVTEGGC